MTITKEQKNTLLNIITTQPKENAINYVQRNFYNEQLGPQIMGMLFEKIAEPTDGHSGKIYIHDIERINKHFRSSNGSQWARTNKSYLGSKYNLKKTYCEVVNGVKETGISTIQLDGFNDTNIQRFRGIASHIKNFFKNKPCVFSGTTRDVEIDHKNGKYTDWRNQNPQNQRPEDFQPLCKSANDTKREICKKCNESGKRFDARTIGFSNGFLYGDENTPTCPGCFWHDIEKFRRESSKNYRKPDEN